jgi:UDP-N-acetylglucosamine 2-epimerase (non-hydrolysing)
MSAPAPVKLLLVAGARPNFMKIQPLLRQAEEDGRLRDAGARRVETLFVHTGQHYDENMSEVFFRELGIRPPEINLEVGSGSHAVQTANVMMRFEAVCERERPDWVVVVGDVNSTLACTLTAVKMGIRVAHVEAGLRSYDRTMPEEINRVVTDALADLLLTPSADADENLARVGNIMIDSLVQNLPKARASGIVARLGLETSRFIYVTLHRPANVDERESLSAVVAALEPLSERMPVVWPIHPRTRKKLDDFRLAARTGTGLRMLEPLGYHASLALAEQARIVLTDSGGLQEEATYFRTPCLTLRPNTERPVTITLGSNRLTSVGSLPDDVSALLAGPERIGQVPPLWDGRTAERIYRHLLEAVD